uniref:AAA domain-containing protein n=1 Tax=Macrostomum lignano TaxID=282301 RepID=A0A1I8FPL5_9PLAT
DFARQRRSVDFNSDERPYSSWRPLPPTMAAAASAAASCAWSCATYQQQGSGGGGSFSDALAFATLVPQSGAASGTICLLASTVSAGSVRPTWHLGKTFLAGGSPVTWRALERRRSDDDEEADVSGAVAEFSGELRRSEQELRAFLAEAVAQSVAEPDPKRPSRGVQVLLLDSLQHLGPLAEARSGLAASRLYIISAPGFRWLLCANHLEPVRGLLGRTFADNAWWPKLPSRRPKQTAEPPRRHQLDDWLPGPGSGPGAAARTPRSDRGRCSAARWTRRRHVTGLSACGTTRWRQVLRRRLGDPADWVMSTWPWPELPPGDGELVRLRSQTAARGPVDDHADEAEGGCSCFWQEARKTMF